MKSHSGGPKAKSSSDLFVISAFVHLGNAGRSNTIKCAIWRVLMSFINLAENRQLGAVPLILFHPFTRVQMAGEKVATRIVKQRGMCPRFLAYTSPGCSGGLLGLPVEEYMLMFLRIVVSCHQETAFTLVWILRKMGNCCF